MSKLTSLYSSNWAKSLYMRYTFFTLILLLSVSALIAQPFGAGRSMGAQMGAAPNGRIYGKIIDSISGKPVEFASVQLLQNKIDSISKQRKETVIGGMLTQSNGDFSIENVPLFGPLKLKVTAIGFKETQQSITFSMPAPGAAPVGNTRDMSAMLSALDKDLGNIKIQIEDKVLENVTVQSSRPGLQLGIDRKVFNVDKNIVSAGGTAIDIMRNVPSLNVDIDGNVTMRNNSPQIFVDGRPSNLTLEQIPADAIQSVELITNPSAKFDASGGTAGILNIVLKKEKKVGYNGSLRANIDSRARIGLGGDINLRQQKVNFFVNGMYNQRKSISTGKTERLNLFDNPDTYMFQSDRSVQTGYFAFVRGGVDYFISNRNTLSASINYVNGNFRPTTKSDIYVDTLSTPVGSSFYHRDALTKGGMKTLGSMLSFKHNFPKNGMEWTADVTYNNSRNSNSSNLATDTFNVVQNTVKGTYKQFQDVKGDNENIIIQTDFVNPITDKIKLELGARAQLRSNTNTSSFYLDNNGTYILQPASQTNYKSNDQVYAAYVNYSQQFKSFGYQLGLRAESSQYNGELLTTGEVFKIDFPISLFPSVFLSQKLGDDQSIQINYSRRINRPNFWQLNPITDSSDQINPRQGNPGLKPEFTNSFELSYEKTMKNRDNFLASLYYKNTNDLITAFQVKEDINGKEIVLNTFINASSSYVTGLELTSRNRLAKWWELTSNLNLFNSDIKIDDPNVQDQKALTSWFAKLNNSFTLPNNITIQLSGDYQSKTILPPGGSGSSSSSRGGFGGGGGGGFGFGGASASQGYVRPNYGIDIAVRYDFLKSKTASLSVNMNDVFRTRVNNVYSASSFFQQDVFRRRDPQVLRVTFNWRFGKFDANLMKRKNNKNMGDTQSMDMGPMGGGQ